MNERADSGIGATPQIEAPGDLQEIGIGMLGYAFMGKAHSNALRKIAYMTWPPPLVPRLVAIAGRNEQAVAAAAQRYGYERWTTDWRDVVADESPRRASSISAASTTASCPRCGSHAS
jgi:predicted dehydrogenase